jgi:hypothetical protein
MTNRELGEFNGLLNEFNKISNNGINEFWEKWLLQVLPNSMPFFTHLIAYYNFPTLERITINRNILGSNKRIKNIDFLKYPPADKVKKYGRCNLKQKSIFYGAPMIMTALSEMRPKVGDLITKSIWKLSTEHTFKVCPIFHFQPTNGTMNPRTFELEQDFYKEVNKNYSENFREAVINLSKFIAFHFSKNVNSENDRDYIFSAFFADKLLNELDGGSIEGLVYPSVKERLSFENVALKPEIFDQHFLLYEVHESVVVKDPSDGGGGLLMKGITDCKQFDYENKLILWGNNIMQPPQDMQYYKEKFNLDLS